MKTKKILFIVIVLLLVGSFIYYVATFIINSEKAKKLAQFGENQFLSNDFDNYLLGLCTPDINDISGDANFSYTIGEDYSPSEKTLYLECVVDNLTSDKIDKYYTDTYNKEPGTILAQVMAAVDNRFVTKTYTYRLENVGNVIVSAKRGSCGIALTTSNSRKYIYSYSMSKDMFTVEIDSHYAYLSTNFSYANTSPNDPYPWDGKCALDHCDSLLKDGSRYCHTHSCCEDGCINYKEPLVHCCDAHSCKHPGCGSHKYKPADSDYCLAHYHQH